MKEITRINCIKTYQFGDVPVKYSVAFATGTCESVALCGFAFPAQFDSRRAANAALEVQRIADNELEGGRLLLCWSHVSKCCDRHAFCEGCRGKSRFCKLLFEFERSNQNKAIKINALHQ